MIETVIDGIGAVILSGGLGCGLTNFLGECGNTGVLFRVDHDIIVPEVTTFGGRRMLIARDCGAGQAYEESRGRGSDHFGNSGLHTQPQAGTQATLDGLTVLIGLVHDDGIVSGCDISFQCVLNSSGVLCHGIGQGLIQSIGSVVVIGAVQLVGVVCIFIAACAIFQTDGSQQIGRYFLVEAIQNLGHIVVGMLVIGGFSESHHISNPNNGELGTLDGIAVGVLAIAQGVVGIAVGIALTDGVAQNFFNIALPPAGADKRIFIPDTILHGVGPVKLPDGQRTLCVHIDGCILIFSGRSGNGAGYAHEKCQTQGDGLDKLGFHFRFPFKNRLLLFGIALKMKKAREHPLLGRRSYSFVMPSAFYGKRRTAWCRRQRYTASGRHGRTTPYWSQFSGVRMLHS